jgi:hypothetical protein
MFRKRIIIDVGGYSEDASYVEDYDLWSRLLYIDPLCLASIPHVGVWHRKHHGKSERSVQQERNADCIALQKMKELVDTGGTFADVYLSRPDLAKTPSDLDNAAQLLLNLSSQFLQRHHHAGMQIQIKPGSWMATLKC